VAKSVRAAVAAVDAPTATTRDFAQDASADAAFHEVVGRCERDAQGSLDLADIGDRGSHEMQDQFPRVTWCPHGISTLKQVGSRLVEGHEVLHGTLACPRNRAPDVRRPRWDGAARSQCMTALAVGFGIDRAVQVKDVGWHAHAAGEPGSCCEPRELAVAVGQRRRGFDGPDEPCRTHQRLIE